ncbi:MAG: potassium uptake system protein [Deltaproteobacteria bacterium GWC2_42_11]|nr:MAG: potassium uptake system protein [Deltaproteobacteria bacterium GWC2_42_11]
MRKFAVIGLGRFGYGVAKTLTEKGCEVLAIDSDEEKVKDVSNFVTHAVQLDATDEDALHHVGIQYVDVAVVSIGENIEASILIVMTLKEMGVKEVVAKAVTPIHGKVLRNIGVSKVVFPERDMAIKIANSLAVPNILEQIELSSEYSIIETTVPENIAGRTLIESGIRDRFGVNVIAVKKRVPTITESGEPDFVEEWNVSPMPEDRLEEGDVLVLLGPNEGLNKLKKG